MSLQDRSAWAGGLHQLLDLEQRLLAPPFLNMDLEYLQYVTWLVIWCFLFSKRIPLSTTSPVHCVISLKWNNNRRSFHGSQVAHLALQSSGNSGWLNLTLSCVCSYARLSHYLTGIALDLCWCSGAVWNCTWHIFPCLKGYVLMLGCCLVHPRSF